MKLSKRQLAYCKAYLSYFVIASAQFLCPAAAADPASKINPPEWSIREVQEQIEAYEMQEIEKEHEEVNDLRIQETKLKLSIQSHDVNANRVVYR